MSTIKRKELQDYLELDCCFRDYYILPKKMYGKVSKQGVHQQVDHIETDVQNALYTFNRDGFGTIYFYI